MPASAQRYTYTDIHMTAGAARCTVFAKRNRKKARALIVHTKSDVCAKVRARFVEVYIHLRASYTCRLYLRLGKRLYVWVNL